MIHLAAIILFSLGFVALAISMKRHQRDIVGRRLSDRERRVARAGGSLLILTVLAMNMLYFDPAYGAIVWFGQLSIAAWAIVGVLCWRIKAG